MMKTAGTKSAITAMAGVMLAAVLLLAGCGNSESQTVADERVPVLVESVRRDDLKVVRTYTGSVEGIRQTTICARIPETVTKVHADEGDMVRAGDVVVSFDEGGPTSVLRQASVVWEDAKKTAEKFERLYQQGAVSEIEYDARKAAADVAKANFESAREQTRLTSSISGVLTDLYTRVGERESAGNPVALIAAIDTVRVLVEVSVYESRDLQKGQPVLVRSELDPSITAHGWISEISSSANALTRTLSLEILADNRERRLMPGFFVRAEIELETRQQVITIPREALVYRETGLGVFVTNETQAHYRVVEIGVESGRLVEIISGVEAGEQVVVLGQGNLQEGTLIDPIHESDDQPGVETP